MGSLKLQGSTDCSTFTTLWSKSGNQGSGWNTATVDVTGGTEYTCMQVSVPPNPNPTLT